MAGMQRTFKSERREYLGKQMVLSGIDFYSYPCTCWFHSYSVRLVISMNRAELRREKKKKYKTPTYNVTEEQLNLMIQQKLNEAMERKRDAIVEEVTNQSVALMLMLPMKVLMEDYWPKSYKQKMPKFIDRTLELYSKWQDNELNMKELEEELWESAGIRLESCKVED